MPVNTINLVATPGSNTGQAIATTFTSIAIGSGHSSGGSDYATGSPVYAWKFITVPVVATTVTATKSATTTYAVSGFTVGDYVNAVVGTASGLSLGVTLDAWMSAGETVTIQYSNVSTANASQITTNVVLECCRIVA